jgi:molybdopterin synthase sulfur carrier subunit
MAQVEFTPNLSRHIDCKSVSVTGSTVQEILLSICTDQPQLKHYLLDDQDRLRKHVTVFIDNLQIRDRTLLSDPVQSGSTIYIAQALSGG